MRKSPASSDNAPSLLTSRDCSRLIPAGIPATRGESESHDRSATRTLALASEDATDQDASDVIVNTY